MSVTSLVLALLPAIAARRKPKAEPQKPVEQFALDYWRKAYATLEDENERLARDLQRLMDENARLRAENGVMRDRDRRRDYWRAQNAQALQAQDYQKLAQLAQYQNQQNQQNQQQNQQLAQYQHGLLGAQNLGTLEDFCNCAPGRASLLLDAE